MARRFLGVFRRGDDNLPLQQTRIRVRRGRCATSPRVSSEMMVIATGRHEECAGIAPHDFVEPAGVMIEGLGLGDVVDVEMHVTEHSTGRHSRPALAARGAYE